MKRWIAACCVVSVFPALLQAKGQTTQIDIAGPGRASIRTTDPKVGQFNIWEGPGVGGVTLNSGDGFIVAWQQDPVVNRPSGLKRYEVLFYVGEEKIPAYAVSYEFDPATKHGFVYVPGRGEPSYSMNARSIHRGPAAEGHWFPATDAWNRFVSPLIGRSN